MRFYFFGKNMIEFDNSKNVIKRILSAYKLKTVKSLADKWNLTASVIGSRVQRNTFHIRYWRRSEMALYGRG